MADLERALADGDLDELVRGIDQLCDDQAWDRLVEVRDRCRLAYERTGRQLWPAASLAEYRLALEAPGEFAALVLVEGTGHLALGPLPEVAASTHAWADLAPHVAPGPPAWLAAHERVVRGEDLRPYDDVIGNVVDVPLVLADWEPDYLVPAYRADEVELAAPPAARLARTWRPAPGVVVDDPATTRALAALVERWVVESDAAVTVVAVEGTAESAAACLSDGESLAWTDTTTQDAVARMAWAGAAGGSHGRRRGAATGRFDALWALAAVAGLLEDWPADPDDLGAAADELRWCLWHPDEPAVGWSLHLAVEDPADGMAWALAAVDRSPDPEADSSA